LAVLARLPVSHWPVVLIKASWGRAEEGLASLIIINFARSIFELILYVSVLGLVSVGASFLILIAINLIELATGRLWREPLPPIKVSEADLPHVLVQIPAFNEGEIAVDALRGATMLDWPKDKLHIQLLDDSTDVAAVAAAAAASGELRAQGFDVQHLRRENRDGFKAGALAEGMAKSSAPIIAILDIDFRPPRHWLRVTVPYLLADARAGFLQSRCEFANYRANWLTRIQGMMMDAHFVMEQATRYRAGWLFQFNGTGGLWRRAAIDAAGGWLGDSLSEDFDLMVRAELAGWHGIFLMAPAIPGQVPERLDHWRVQQRRWSNGFVQVARKLLHDVWTAPWTFGKKMSATALILIQIFYPCAAIATASFLICVALRGFDPTPYLPLLAVVITLIVIIAVGMTLMPYLMLRRGSLWQYMVTVSTVTPMLVYVSLSNAPSILKTVFGHSEDFKRTPKSRDAISSSQDL
jgi:cellulose synthase/poly-beta-1,6-N-acetylglucosamine synthase-like glycosyltransferase